MISIKLNFRFGSASGWGQGAGREDRFRCGAELKMLSLEVGLSCLFRYPWWPMDKCLHTEIKTLQRSLIASMMRVPRAEGEEIADYLRRRGRLAAEIAVRGGEWGSRVAARIVSWDEHVSRGHVFLGLFCELRS